MRRIFHVAAIATILFGLPAAGQEALVVEREPGTTRLWVDSQDSPRQLLRETLAEVQGLRSGSGPAGKARFATWEESGRRFAAYSRDFGASWSDARAIETELRLRIGSVDPASAMPGAPAGYELPAAGRLFVVQFRTVGLPEWREALSAAGAEVLSHVPYNAHVVRADPALAVDLARFEFVERVEPYHPWYRIDDELKSWLAGSAGEAERRIRATAFEWGPEAKGRLRSSAENLGGRAASWWESGHVVELWLTRVQLKQLASHDDAMWFDLWTPRETDMDLVRVDSGADRIEETSGYCGQGVRGEVMDGGVQDDHPDFDGLLPHGTYSSGSHGTATYGIVFGNGARDGDGDSKATGLLPCAEQGIFADYDEFTDRFAHTQELKNPPYEASFQTNSWGNQLTQSYNSDTQEMDDIIFRLDIAITQSQSNNGNQSSRPQAWAKNVISVGGVRHYETLDTADDAWDFGASIGPAADGRIKPDVSYWYDSIYTTALSSGYRDDFGGTSAATPETAGVLGLMVQMWADNVWETDPAGATVFQKQPHFSTIKALLLNNANQYDFVGASHDLSRFKQGWGRPSAGLAYDRALNSLVIDQDVQLQLNDSVTWPVDVQPGESELKVTMVYPDPAGTTSASMHRINDLDLEVTSPSGTVYRGNYGLEDGTVSLPNGTADTLNTVENVIVANPEAGAWDVKVTAVEINQDGDLGTPATDATFALVVTGGAGRYTSGLGRARLVRDVMACGDDVSIRVRDGNVAGSTLAVELRSETESAPETVILSETAPGSGKYTGQLSTTNQAPSGSDGKLSVSDDDLITLEYVDLDDGSGGNGVRQATATMDCGAPEIFAVQGSAIDGAQAVVSWTTDEPSTSTVLFGSSTPPGQPAATGGLVTDHSVPIAGLAECTVYYFSVGSDDVAGNSSVDDNGGAFYHFETLGDFGDGLQPCHEGRVYIETDPVGCSSTMPVRVVDIDLNADPGAAETLTVSVSSSTEILPETLVLTETGPDTSIFVGSLPTAPGAVVSGDGVLQVDEGDLLTATYVDPDDGTGNPATTFDTARVDCSPPDHLSVTVRNITATTATVEWTTSKPTTGVVEWGNTQSLGNLVSSTNLATTHGVTIGSFDECGPVWFRIVSTDAEGYVGIADVGGEPLRFDAYGIPGVLFQDDFESDLGWSLTGEWEIDAPAALGSAPGDPASAFRGSFVLGHDLTGLGAHPGDHEPSTNEAATSPSIDTSSLTQVELQFERHLNVANGTLAFLELKTSGGSWQALWTSPTSGGLTESSWSHQIYNVSAFAAGNPDFQIRFRNQSYLGTSFAAGWNVDKVILRDSSLPPYATCAACITAPTFVGLAAAVDDDPCADSGVSLSWPAASSWGSGLTGSYVVYRNTLPGFTPSAANRVASGIVGASWTDPAAPNDVDLYYVVQAENDETCSTGPANGGVLEANTVRVQGRNATGQAAPGDPGNTLLLEPVNGAHVQLNWAAAPGAAVYHVYGATTPTGSFGLISADDGTSYDDPGALADGASRFYLVRGADSCGNESF